MLTLSLKSLLEQSDGHDCEDLDEEEQALFQWWLRLGLLETTLKWPTLGQRQWFSPTNALHHPRLYWRYRFKRPS